MFHHHLILLSPTTNAWKLLGAKRSRLEEDDTPTYSVMIDILNGESWYIFHCGNILYSFIKKLPSYLYDIFVFNIETLWFGLTCKILYCWFACRIAII